MYGKTVYIGKYEVFVLGSPSDPEWLWIKKAKAQVIQEIKNSEGRTI